MLAWAVLWLALGGLVRWLRGKRSSRSGRQGAPSRAFPPDRSRGLALLLAAALILGMRSLLLAVKVVSDGPIYHLLFRSAVVESRAALSGGGPVRRERGDLFSGERRPVVYLAPGELGGTVGEGWAAPFLVLAAVAAFGCARTLGAGRSASLVATCWFASSTPFLLYSFEPNVDTIFVAGYMMAAYFFLRGLAVKAACAALCLGALAAGEALGTKAVGVVFIPPLLAAGGGGDPLRRAGASHQDRPDLWSSCSFHSSPGATGTSATRY